MAATQEQLDGAVTVAGTEYQISHQAGREYVDVLDADGAVTWRGNPGFVPNLVQVDSVHLSPTNAREKHHLKSIGNSLREHGQQDWIKVTPKGEVIAGNGRLHAAISELSWSLIAAGVFDADALRQMNYAVADNRTAERSAWNYEVLAGQLPELTLGGFDPLDFGWQQHDLDVILNADWSPADQTDMDEFGGDPDSMSVKFSRAERAVIVAACKSVAARDETEYTPAEALTIIAAEWQQP